MIVALRTRSGFDTGTRYVLGNGSSLGTETAPLPGGRPLSAAAGWAAGCAVACAAGAACVGPLACWPRSPGPATIEDATSASAKDAGFTMDTDLDGRPSAAGTLVTRSTRARHQAIRP